MKVVSWFSAGVSSAVAAYLALRKYPTMEIIYIDIDDQHPDSMRFVKDCEKQFGKTIQILKSRYGSVGEVIRSQRFINGPHGAKCSQLLKRRVREAWERKNPGHCLYIWGMDSSKREMIRATKLRKDVPDFSHEFPLIDQGISKKNAHAIVKEWGINRPVMYDLGYPNNNCIGCVKAGMGYWNKIRTDFPQVFKERAAQERELGHSCIKGVFLDELEEDRGRNLKIIVPDCGMFCETE